MQGRTFPGGVRSILALGIAVGLLGACAARERVQVLYFFSAVCPSCEESQRAVRGASSAAYAASRDARIEVHVYDVYRDEEAMDALLAAVDRFKVPVERQGLPLLIVNGEAYSGLDEVEPALAKLQTAGRR